VTASPAERVRARRTWRRWLAGGALALALTAGGAGLYTHRWLSRSGLPQRTGTARLAGLTAEVVVRFDAHGVPHVEAASTPDSIAALGWLHANDRMTQMELSRRAAAGRLAEILGAPLVPTDAFFHELGVPGAVRTQWEAAGAESRELLEAYARGVNAWLDARGDDLPPGLALLDVDPEPWEPTDSLGVVLLQAVGLSFLFESEVQRALALARMGDAAVRDFAPGAEPLSVTDELRSWLREKELGHGPPETARERGGSNAFAVDATRTASGHVLVANDPHLELGLPAVWYQVQLRAPDYEAAGMTLPGLPLVVIGQNATLAWAITNSGLDNHDLFIEDVEDGAYRRGSDLVEIETRTVEIAVRGGPPVELELESTDIGPCSTNWFAGVPTSLAWTAHEPQDAIATLLGLARATSLAGVRGAIADFVAPAQNLLVGHREEGLLRTVLGRRPLRAPAGPRPAPDGQVPTIGRVREHRWRGLRPQAEQPLVLDPPSGFLATANDDPRPPDWSRPFPAELDVPHRAERARAQLAARDDWTAGALLGLQSDTTSLYAREILSASLAACEPDLSPPARSARARLSDWSGAHATESAEAALYAFYEHALYEAIFRDELDRAELVPEGIGYQERRRLLRAVTGDLELDWIDDVTTEARETRGDVVARALERAWLDCSDVLGDPSGVRYGDLHRWTPRHPLAAIPIVGPWIYGVGSFEAPGSATCLNAFAAPPAASGRRDVVFGPSMRFVADVHEPDRSLACLPGGQSGHPFDPHYADQLEDFMAGRAHAVRWTADAIEAATVSRLTLVPRIGQARAGR